MIKRPGDAKAMSQLDIKRTLFPLIGCSIEARVMERRIQQVGLPALSTAALASVSGSTASLFLI